MWLSFLASDRTGGRSRHHHHEALDRQFRAKGADPVEDVQWKEQTGSRRTSSVDRK